MTISLDEKIRNQKLPNGLQVSVAFQKILSIISLKNGQPLPPMYYVTMVVLIEDTEPLNGAE
jgi:hypothetical protein